MVIGGMRSMNQTNRNCKKNADSGPQATTTSHMIAAMDHSLEVRAWRSFPVMARHAQVGPARRLRSQSLGDLGGHGLGEAIGRFLAAQVAGPDAFAEQVERGVS